LDVISTPKGVENLASKRIHRHRIATEVTTHQIFLKADALSLGVERSMPQSYFAFLASSSNLYVANSKHRKVLAGLLTTKVITAQIIEIEFLHADD